HEYPQRTPVSPRSGSDEGFLTSAGHSWAVFGWLAAAKLLKIVQGCHARASSEKKHRPLLLFLIGCGTLRISLFGAAKNRDSF
ncbi:MAG: hypothetical protein R3Y04_06890, partial [Rikenellaceae bacterium]